MNIETFINISLFVMLVVTAISIVRLRKLFGVVMLSGVFSLLSALLFVSLDAVDVAFTEAASKFTRLSRGKTRFSRGIEQKVDNAYVVNNSRMVRDKVRNYFKHLM